MWISQLVALAVRSRRSAPAPPIGPRTRLTPGELLQPRRVLISVDRKRRPRDRRHVGRPACGWRRHDRRSRRRRALPRDQRRDVDLDHVGEPLAWARPRAISGPRRARRGCGLDLRPRDALAEPVPGAAPGLPASRAETTIVVADPAGGVEPMRFRLHGNHEPEASSIDDERLFPIQYLPAETPAVYRVVVLELSSGEVRPVHGRVQDRRSACPCDSARCSTRPGRRCTRAVLEQARRLRRRLRGHRRHEPLCRRFLWQRPRRL